MTDRYGDNAVNCVPRRPEAPKQFIGCPYCYARGVPDCGMVREVVTCV